MTPPSDEEVLAAFRAYLGPDDGDVAAFLRAGDLRMVAAMAACDQPCSLLAAVDGRWAVARRPAPDPQGLSTLGASATGREVAAAAMSRRLLFTGGSMFKGVPPRESLPPSPVDLSDINQLAAAANVSAQDVERHREAAAAVKDVDAGSGRARGHDVDAESEIGQVAPPDLATLVHDIEAGYVAKPGSDTHKRGLIALQQLKAGAGSAPIDQVEASK